MLGSCRRSRLSKMVRTAIGNVRSKRIGIPASLPTRTAGMSLHVGISWCPLAQESLRTLRHARGGGHPSRSVVELNEQPQADSNFLGRPRGRGKTGGAFG